MAAKHLAADYASSIPSARFGSPRESVCVARLRRPRDDVVVALGGFVIAPASNPDQRTSRRPSQLTISGAAPPGGARAAARAGG